MLPDGQAPSLKRNQSTANALASNHKNGRYNAYIVICQRVTAQTLGKLFHITVGQGQFKRKTSNSQWHSTTCNTSLPNITGIAITQTLHETCQVIITFLSRRDAGVKTAALSPFGTACCARTALHDRPNKHTQTYVSCTPQKLRPSSVFTSRSRLDSERAHGLVRSDSMDFVRFNFSSFSSASVGMLLFDKLPMT